MATHRDRYATNRRHRNIRYLEQTIRVADYEGGLRQIAVTGLGRDKPTLLLTNNCDETARQIMTRYTSRNGIEDSLGSGVNFFHLDCLASEVPLNVDLDAALTVLANGCYRWLASELDGFTEAKPKRPVPEDHRDRRDGSGHRGADPRPLREAGAQPDLEASGARRQSRSDPLGRWQDPPLHLRRDGLTRPKSVSRFPSAKIGVQDGWGWEEWVADGRATLARGKASETRDGLDRPDVGISPGPRGRPGSAGWRTAAS